MSQSLKPWNGDPFGPLEGAADGPSHDVRRGGHVDDRGTSPRPTAAESLRLHSHAPLRVELIAKVRKCVTSTVI